MMRAMHWAIRSTRGEHPRASSSCQRVVSKPVTSKAVKQSPTLTSDSDIACLLPALEQCLAFGDHREAKSHLQGFVTCPNQGLRKALGGPENAGRALIKAAQISNQMLQPYLADRLFAKATEFFEYCCNGDDGGATMCLILQARLETTLPLYNCPSVESSSRLRLLHSGLLTTLRRYIANHTSVRDEARLRAAVVCAESAGFECAEQASSLLQEALSHAKNISHSSSTRLLTLARILDSQAVQAARSGKEKEAAQSAAKALAVWKQLNWPLEETSAIIRCFSSYLFKLAQAKLQDETSLRKATEKFLRLQRLVWVHTEDVASILTSLRTMTTLGIVLLNRRNFSLARTVCSRAICMLRTQQHVQTTDEVSPTATLLDIAATFLERDQVDNALLACQEAQCFMRNNTDDVNRRRFPQIVTAFAALLYFETDPEMALMQAEEAMMVMAVQQRSVQHRLRLAASRLYHLKAVTACDPRGQLAIKAEEALLSLVTLNVEREKMELGIASLVMQSRLHYGHLLLYEKRYEVAAEILLDVYFQSVNNDVVVTFSAPHMVVLKDDLSFELEHSKTQTLAVPCSVLSMYFRCLALFELGKTKRLQESLFVLQKTITAWDETSLSGKPLVGNVNIACVNGPVGSRTGYVYCREGKHRESKEVFARVCHKFPDSVAAITNCFKSLETQKYKETSV